MLARRVIGGLSLLCLGFAVFGCSAPNGLDSIQVSPTAQALSVGQTTQFSVVGTYGNAKHPTTQPITTGLIWASSNPSVASITTAGLVAAVGSGTATITATASAFNGVTSSSATVTVTPASGGVSGGNIVSMVIIPNSQAVAAPAQTTQFIAIGTTSSGATVNLTNQVAWSSSSTQIATINATTGLATAVGKGSSTVTAIYSAGATVVTGTATFTVTGGATQQFTAVAITPSAQALSASGQTSQLVALGTSGSTGLQTDVTNSSQITWSSSSPSIATVSPSGLITGVSAGTSTITAELKNADSTVVSNTATVAVSITAAPEPLLSLTIIPPVITVGNLQDTGQFIAIGTFSVPPYVRDLTNNSSLTWISSFPSDFPVNTISNSGGNPGATAGIVTAYASGSATIIAEAKNPDGSIQTATATFNCPLALPNPNGNPPTPGSCIQGTQAPSLLATLTVYTEGLNYNGNGLITASSATGTPNVLHCGTGLGDNGVNFGAPVCVATYPPVTPNVVLREHAEPGIAFGGWSSTCTPSDAQGNTNNPPAINPATDNYCTLNITAQNPNITVGAIFN
jgi:uncharacterized protein YjdB